VPAGLGQVDAAAVPHEQPGTQPAFEILQVGAQRRLGHVQPGGGPGQRAFLGDGDDVP
jgi:hypothetical protein